MSQERPPARAPKETPEQAEAYRRGTPASRRASLIVLLVIWLVVIGAALVLVFVFHKTLDGGGRF
jgi:flagellar basal body-associated protein FliL